MGELFAETGWALLYFAQSFGCRIGGDVTRFRVRAQLRSYLNTLE
jgi:hypothetical protein